MKEILKDAMNYADNLSMEMIYKLESIETQLSYCNRLLILDIIIMTLVSVYHHHDDTTYLINHSIYRLRYIPFMYLMIKAEKLARSANVEGFHQVRVGFGVLAIFYVIQQFIVVIDHLNHMRSYELLHTCLIALIAMFGGSLIIYSVSKIKQGE